MPRAAKLLQDRCQSVVGLLGELLGVVPLHTSVLVPLARVAMQALTVDGIPLLQGKAIGGLWRRLTWGLPFQAAFVPVYLCVMCRCRSAVVNCLRGRHCYPAVPEDI